MTPLLLLFMKYRCSFQCVGVCMYVVKLYFCLLGCDCLCLLLYGRNGWVVHVWSVVCYYIEACLVDVIWKLACLFVVL